ncbi:B-cell linker protein isoform 1 [Mus musculus]|uniref:B-cell linker protein n=1 Tax=Mus musculus TaxID=10090 RepID=BLNK_MOUSE|nr:B-cell linker protein isoform 1 [Mus musculus]Q9QUN3.1 RecName: Full=B-cell linker protein; AltName: Full=B-cell adapter containing a SH2 domain protein; AltName: Full=B-cell adapter containing a Src homology 2 domain protein; AltName: Full=Cytoplasmic adapter protein; AltName: Full=Lymphocyte antigen 57; AltName: Full=Src homology 2 domain-containing leukocyte protein of 65 kDa; Short=Slp-65 [Mus musculus]AAH59785.1 B-cell linker [synthetic construct]ABK42135.1 BLNK [synthetic construct]CAA|eukprot:NP_032554.2 B-cell linker protein [Mus musculus]
MDKLNKITVPASQKLRQLQKMVHDIKNNEGGIMDKIKKLKVKGPPSVPRRDYALDSPADEEEQWSDDFDSDYENPDEHSDSEMYVMPAEETGDDSYEPPPAEQQTRVVHPALPFTRGEYVDNRSSQRHSPPFSKTLPSKPSWPSAKARLASTLPAPNSLQKPQVPPKPKDLLEDEADYVVPVEDNDENYIHPRESSPPPAEKAPMVNRSTKPNSSSKHMSPPGTVAGRNSGVWDSKSSLPAAPSPLPRAGKKPATPLKTTPVPPLPNASNVCEEKPVPAERHRGSSHRQDTVQSPVFPPTQKPVHQKPVPLPRFPEAGSPAADGPFHSFPFNSTFADQEAELLGKPWYAGACDRKSAEEALHRSNKDGSFLIRKSSGHDSKQPYTLVAFFNKRVYNIPVRFIEATKQYALGKKKNGEEYFGSVVEIVNSHQHNPLVLIDSQNNTKDSTRLKYAVKVS